MASATFKDGIIDPNIYAENPEELLVGMTAAMCGSFLLISLATVFSLPVSGTHAIIGAIIGFSIVAKGFESVLWTKVLIIVSSWLSSPIISGVVSLVLFLFTRTFILRSRNSFNRCLAFLPVCYGGTLALNLFFIIYKGSPGLNLDDLPLWSVLIIAFGSGVVIAIVVALLLPFIKQWAIQKYNAKINFRETEKTSIKNAEHSRESLERQLDPQSIPDPLLLSKEKQQLSLIDTPHEITITIEEDQKIKVTDSLSSSSTDVIIASTSEKVFQVEEFDPMTEELFSFLQILTAICGSFAHGANDIANAIGPIAIVLSIYSTGMVTSSAAIPWYVLFYGAIGLVLGLALFGYKVMKTIGENLAKVTPSRGFTIEFGAALTVLVASRLGLPISTTHCKVGAVVGVGFADGTNAINWRMVLNVVGGWLVTLPISGFVSAVVFSWLYWGFDYEWTL